MALRNAFAQQIGGAADKPRDEVHYDEIVLT